MVWVHDKGQSRHHSRESYSNREEADLTERSRLAIYIFCTSY